MYWLAGRPGGIPQRLVDGQARRGDALYCQGRLRLVGCQVGWQDFRFWVHGLSPGVIYAK